MVDKKEHLVVTAKIKDIVVNQEIAAIRERVGIRLQELDASDQDIARQMKALQRIQKRNNADREILAWILNGDPNSETVPEPQDDGALDIREGIE